MKRNSLVELAKKALSNPNQQEVDSLLKAVNLSRLQKEVVIRSEINKTDLETICNFDKEGNPKKKIYSYSHIVRIKKEGMEKIGQYLKDNKTIKKR